MPGVVPGAVPGIVTEVLRSPGEPLDFPTRSFFKSRFGHDFSRVRVHVDSKAAESARTVNALAYTAGSNIVFKDSQYKPESFEGRHLIEHELVHVIQQREISSELPSQMGTAIGESSDRYEVEAERIVSQIDALDNNNKISPAIQVSEKVPSQVLSREVSSPPACPVDPLRPITDPDAILMERGATVIWNNTAPGLRPAANRLVASVRAEPGGSAEVQSACRPQAYQDHLREVREKARAPQGNTSPACQAVRAQVNREMNHHGLSVNRPVARRSNHTSGYAVDIAWSLPAAANAEVRIDQLAAQAGLRHPLHERDRPHFELGR